jgi:hypothetical protein
MFLLTLNADWYTSLGAVISLVMMRSSFPLPSIINMKIVTSVCRKIVALNRLLLHGAEIL